MFGCKRPSLIQFAGSLANIQICQCRPIVSFVASANNIHNNVTWNTEGMTELFDIVTAEG